MTVEQWYRRASALPFFTTVLAGLLGTPYLHPNATTITKIALLVAVIGMYAAVPYALFLVIVWFFFRPVDEPEYRRTALLAPVLIAVPFGVVASLIGSGFDGGGLPLLRSVAFYGISALIAGYAYVGLVELGAIVVRRRSRRSLPMRHHD